MTVKAASAGAQPKAEFSDELISRIARLRNEAARKKFLSAHRQLASPETVRQLADVVRRYARINTRDALAIAEFTVTLARELNHQPAHAHSLLAKGGALYAVGDHRASLEQNAQAVAIFRALGMSTDLARTLNASIQPHILLGEYDEAMAAAQEARVIFRAEGNQWRLARVEQNVGNIFHRQDRFDEALKSYERACEYFLAHEAQDPEGLAVTLHNMAVCLISMNEFHRALSTYQMSREIAERHAMRLLVSQADYNIAWLYYLRGEYGRAIEMLRAARENCKKTNDQYHFSLCHMDLSEIYLELNLSSEAEQMARDGAALFEELKLGYEAAKCYANFAIALGQQGQVFRAIEIFAKAKAEFIREQNSAWPNLIDLYQALLLYNEGRYFEARRLCVSALDHFRASVLPGKAVLAELLLARLFARTRDLTSAKMHCAAGLERTRALESPILNHQAYCLMGEIELLAGNQDEAYRCYRSARQALETLRSTLHREELKIGFMKNKLEVYEALIDLSLRRNPDSGGVGEAVAYVEQAKSRSLLDLMFKSASNSQVPDTGQSELVRKVTGLREELNWYYHRIELEQLRPEPPSAKRIAGLQAKAREREEEFLRALREAPGEAAASGLAGPGTLSVEEIRSALAPGVLLLDYFRVRDRILVALLTRDGMEIVPLTLHSRVGHLLRLLQFQLSKLTLGEEYARAHSRALMHAAHEHLRGLYQELFAPFSTQITEAQHLVFAPHDLLHHLPFHALFDGERYLIDRYSVSYAPSASIYALCNQKTATRSGSSLVMGVPDAKAPCIADEVHSVSGLLPNVQSFVAEAATLAKLRELGPTSRFVHIATHGFFRKDNPMFSGIRLGDGHLSLYDLYQIRLPAELVALSGCATGMNVVAAGDELLGLVRGLIHAGAQALLLTLWDVDDRSSAQFMSSFYQRFLASGSKASALQHAVKEVREAAPHPFYWAPFFLVGKALAQQPENLS